MDTSLSDVESLELDDNLSCRWRAEMFLPPDKTGVENCENYVEMLDERRKHIQEELQKLLQLTPHSYDAYYKRTQGPQLSPIREQKSVDSSKDNEIPCLRIRSEPIILQEPGSQSDVQTSENHLEETSQIRYARPFLKRGTGLARFNMSKNDFQRPPALYQNKEFKSYLKGDRRKPSNFRRIVSNNQASQAFIRSVPSNVPSRPAVLTKPVREINGSLAKNFDDEVIPTHRAKCSDIQTQKSRGSNDKPLSHPPFKVPKAPVQHLTLKQTGAQAFSSDVDCQEEKENRIFEMLEERVEESDFCSQNSSVQKLFDQSDFTNALKPKKLVYEEVGGGILEVPEEVPEEKNECNEVGTDAEEEPQNNLRVFSEHDIALRVKRKALQDNVKKIFEGNYNPRLKTTGRKFVKKVRIKKTVRSPKKESINLRELKIRLVELEEEKNAFQRDNNKLKRIQKEILDEKLALDKRRREEEKRLKDENDQLLREKEVFLESQKKFIREKLVFEKYCKETKNLPSREEREEIRKLKEEVERLKDILNTKEARFGSAQARLRNQIKALESENRQLKKDLGEAKTTVVKKVSFDSQAVIKNKVINAINQQLGKKIFGTKDKPGPLSAREPSKVVRPKTLRRTKSACELKKPEIGQVDSNEAKSRSSSVEVSDLEDDGAEEPKIIDLLGPSEETSAYFRRSDSADSGVGSRPSASDEDHAEQNNITDCLPDDYCQNAVPSACRFTSNSCPSATFSDYMDLRNRVSTLIDEVEEMPKNEPNLRNRTDCCPSLTRIHSCCCANIHCGAKSAEDGPISKRLLPNGDSEEIYGNGKKRLISGCGDFMRIVYPNGDIREQYLRSLREKYFYNESGIWQTTFTDRPGYQQLDMPDGRTVVYHPDGKVDTLYPNGATARLNQNGAQEWRFATGEIVRTDANGDKILIFPDGRKEFTFKDFTRLEEIDGTIKTLYKDGRQETKLPNGRVRIKDRHGNIIMDTAGFNTVRG